MIYMKIKDNFSKDLVGEIYIQKFEGWKTYYHTIDKNVGS